MKRSSKSKDDTIKCPNCGELIPVTATLHHQLTEQARGELRKEVLQDQKALAAREKELEAKEKKVRAAEADIDDRVTEQLEAAQSRIAKEVLGKARKEVAAEVQSLQKEASEKSKKLEELQKMELQLRKEKREVEEAKKSAELEITRKLDEERARIREETAKQIQEEHSLRDAEKERKLQEALNVNEELRRKLQQGSQQTQGEVLELELEKLLLSHCPADEILPVGKGMKGADVLQRVRTNTGTVCGNILWETKHTKNWSDSWIEKLKNDQREAKADLAVLVSDILPDDVTGFGFRDGVWVTKPRYILGITTALRRSLIDVALAKRATAGKNETVEAVFSYLTGPEFRNRVQAIVRGFVNMQQDLEEGKRIASRRWAKREKQLTLIIENTSGMYGEFEGLLGTSIQPIPALEAGAPDEGLDAVPAEEVRRAETSDEDIPF